MTALSGERRAFYQARHLPLPQEELVPANEEELKEALRTLHEEKSPWQLVGGGHHARFGSRFADQDYKALRTDKLAQLLHLDKKSGLVQVQSGMTWRALQEAVQERGFSLARYGLHPASATIGGLLARYRPGPPALRGGDLVDGCIAISAFSPQNGDYRYLDAPRKSSGPDMRYHFIGAQGKQGAILTATLVVWRPVAAHLLYWDDCSLTRAAKIMDEIFQGGITVSCIHFSMQRRRLQLILSAPGQLLRGQVRWLTTTVGRPTHVGDAEEAQKRRRWLEARHPDRRNHLAAPRTRVVWLDTSRLHEITPDTFGDALEDLEILSWTAQRAEAFLRFAPGAGRPTPGPAPDTTFWATWPMIVTS